MYRKHECDASGRLTTLRAGNDGFSRRSVLISGAAATAAALFPSQLVGSAHAAAGRAPRFKQIPVHYIAALRDPKATPGTNAHLWGLCLQDPRPVREHPAPYY